MLTQDSTVQEAQEYLMNLHKGNMEGLKKSLEASQASLGYQLNKLLSAVFEATEVMSMELTLLKQLEFGIRYRKYSVEDYEAVLGNLDKLREELTNKIKAAMASVAQPAATDNPGKVS